MNTLRSEEEIVSKMNSLYREAQDICEKWHLSMLPQVKLACSKHMSRNTLGLAGADRIAGSSSLLPRFIKLNYIYASSCSDAQFKDTFMHEVAHIWCYAYCGNVGHNTVWRKVAKAFGANPSPYAGTISDNKKAQDEQQESMESLVNARSATSILDKRTVHSLRCSLKQICLRHSCDFSPASFDAYIIPRFKMIYSASQLEQAKQDIFSI